jgi:aminoglycoside 6'-N-acetyltransferase I
MSPPQIMSIDVRLLGPDDLGVFDRVADGVFDHAVRAPLARAFLADARHHMFVAMEDGVVVGMVSAMDYVHPDKAPQLWINEIGVAPSHRRRGIGRRLLDAVVEHGRTLGCTEAWLGTEEDNEAARRLYAAAGGEAEPFVLYSFALTAPDLPQDSSKEGDTDWGKS